MRQVFTFGMMVGLKLSWTAGCEVINLAGILINSLRCTVTRVKSASDGDLRMTQVRECTATLVVTEMYGKVTDAPCRHKACNSILSRRGYFLAMLQFKLCLPPVCVTDLCDSEDQRKPLCPVHPGLRPARPFYLH